MNPESNPKQRPGPEWVLQLCPAFENHPAFEATYYAGYSLMGEPVKTLDLLEAARFHEFAAVSLARNLLGTLSCTWVATKAAEPLSDGTAQDQSVDPAPTVPDAGTATQLPVTVAFRELWCGDRFRLSNNTLWTKQSNTTARRHSPESCALGQRGYGYLGDAVCSFELDDDVVFEPPTDRAERAELAQVAREHGWNDSETDKSLPDFFRDELKSVRISETCTSAPRSAGPLWACYDCGYSGGDFRTRVASDRGFEAQCPSCGGTHSDEASVVLRELVATVDDLREQLPARGGEKTS